MEVFSILMTHAKALTLLLPLLCFLGGLVLRYLSARAPIFVWNPTGLSSAVTGGPIPGAMHFTDAICAIY